MVTNELLAQKGSTSEQSADIMPAATWRTPGELANIVSRFAESDAWMDKVRLRVEGRWYERLYHGADHDIWVISWLPGQSTGFHDHGPSSGALVVTTGTLEEHRAGGQHRVLHPGELCAFDPDYSHDVLNLSIAPAISIHAYSPPLSEMNEYELDGGQLIRRERVSELPQKSNNKDRAPASSIEQVLAAARARLWRLSPEEALEATGTGAILVDIRPESQRAIEGSIADALIVERNVLEWRFDPVSPSRLPVATSHDQQVIVFCSEGYTSSLAAAALQDLGLWQATDVIGGFQAWRAARLPFIAALR